MKSRGLKIDHRSMRRGVRATVSVLIVTMAFGFFTVSPFPHFPISPCSAEGRAQDVVDRMVAVINNEELITYTDLLWQLALEPNMPLDNPRREDLNRALQLVVDQRLFAQEAEKLPTIAPRRREIEDELSRLIRNFPSRAEFYARLNVVGLGENSEKLREIIRQRVAINNYTDFRFRSFTVVTPQEVDDYYREAFVPRFRRDNPGRIVPTIEEKRADLERELEERKIDSDVGEFLEDARARADIIYLVQF